MVYSTACSAQYPLLVKLQWKYLGIARRVQRLPIQDLIVKQPEKVDGLAVSLLVNVRKQSETVQGTTVVATHFHPYMYILPHPSYVNLVLGKRRSAPLATVPLGSLLAKYLVA